jgi:hypothetical protein
MAKSVKASPKKAAKRSAAKSAVKRSTKKAAPKTAKKATKAPLKKATVKKSAVKKSAKATPKKAAKKTATRSSPAPAATKASGKTFLIIYHAPMDAMVQTSEMSPEQQAAGMALWQAWAERAGSKLLDMGAPLMNGKRLAAQSEPAPSTRDVSGYSLVSADDWDEVMSLLEGHPHISGWHPDATIEIHETMALPGM